MHNAVQLSQPRHDVRVTLQENVVLSAPIGTTLEVILESAINQGPLQAQSLLIAAIVDGRLRELNTPLTRDVNVTPVFLNTTDGGRIYRRSLVLLMVTALDELWEGTHVSVNYSVPDGGLYCEVVNRPDLSLTELRRLEERMRHIVAEDAPITRRTVQLSEAQEMFRARGEYDKVRLLSYRYTDTLTLYRLRNREDYYYGYMVPSTRYLTVFKLKPADKGFILQYPRAESPSELPPIKTYHKLSKVFHQTDQWLERLGLEDIGRLNQVVQNNRIQELILVAEALHEQNIAHIATQICEEHQEGRRLILIAGPSSSGKTTFAKRLAIQLLAHGLQPFTLELDNYFVDRHLTPRDESGEYNFEALGALNLERFNQDLLKLMRGEHVQLPRFDFITGHSQGGPHVQLPEKQIIIVEGIHGLNPELVPAIPTERIYRIYVSALTQLNVDLHNRVPTTDVRMLRRIVRDASRRGYSATDTLARWPSVRQGERSSIFPYQENADVMFNSALPYELAALRPLAEPLLLQVVPGTPEHIEAKRLLSFLRWVVALNPHQIAMIPDTSILREFVGGSILDDYHPGRPITEHP